MFVVVVKCFQTNVRTTRIGNLRLSCGVKIVQDSFGRLFAGMKQLVVPVIQQALRRFPIFRVVYKRAGCFPPVQKIRYLDPECIFLG